MILRSYIPFFCERMNNLLIFVRDFSLIEIYEVLDVRIKDMDN